MFRPLVADVDLERKRIYVGIDLKHMVEACVLECVIFGPTKNCNASLSISLTAGGHLDKDILQK